MAQPSIRRAAHLPVSAYTVQGRRPAAHADRGGSGRAIAGAAFSGSPGVGDRRAAPAGGQQAG